MSTDRLIDELWGETPPETAAKGLQVHVSQLRKVLEPDRASGESDQLLVTRAPGYILKLDPEQFDLGASGAWRTRATGPEASDPGTAWRSWAKP